MNIEAKHDRFAAAMRQHDRAAEPVLVLDPERAQVLWANQRAATLLGCEVPGAASALQLDRSMPAARRLAEVAATLPRAGRRLELAWWLKRGVRTLSCEVRPVLMASGASAVLVRVLGGGAAKDLPRDATQPSDTPQPAPSETEITTAEPTAPAAVDAAAAASALPAARNDTATLREIARMIREGITNGGRTDRQRPAVQSPPARPEIEITDTSPPQPPTQARPFTDERPATVANTVSTGTPPEARSAQCAETPLAAPLQVVPLTAMAGLTEDVDRPLGLMRGVALVHANGAMLRRLGFATLSELHRLAGLAVVASPADGTAAAGTRILRSASGGEIACRADRMPEALAGPDAWLLSELSSEAPASAAATAHTPAPLSSSLREPAILARVSHEIRTPLSSIQSFAEIMKEERLGPIGNPKYREYAADIFESARHALSLVGDLLDMARIEAGGLELDRKHVELKEMVAACVASLQPLAQKAQVTLAAPSIDKAPAVIADARSLKQILLNLLSNSLKCTEAGGAVWVTARSGPDRSVTLRVQDTGVGMAADELKAALEPYRQVGPRERRAGGTGLGLALSKALAEANGARLVLESVPGGGLAAMVLFPPDRAAPP